ncbi:hypothetical protein C7S18_13940 [Ahniella affigens]|uniref:SMODS and SLOG-associating 2TM effector domain-containing protein n=1 Tax=Ahniella affigens TaxID=2021234 RepID=A0A2P1PTQ8_9GAMM|nr:SLATT domain-containing protein [Ahniella affigens]AVP98225.1 hypothetical protein C7S18_13940 [Ahniella affigens]
MGSADSLKVATAARTAPNEAASVPAQTSEAADNPTDALIDKMKKIVDSRYQAATRLEHRSKSSFLFVTVFSLAMILVPLLQMTGTKGGLGDQLLSILQIFLAIAVLVYTTYIQAARLDYLGQKHEQCANKINVLKDRLRMEWTLAKADLAATDDQTGADATSKRAQFSLPLDTLQRYQDEYQAILEFSPNHTELDYMRAAAERRSQKPALLQQLDHAVQNRLKAIVERFTQRDAEQTRQPSAHPQFTMNLLALVFWSGVVTAFHVGWTLCRALVLGLHRILGLPSRLWQIERKALSFYLLPAALTCAAVWLCAVMLLEAWPHARASSTASASLQEGSSPARSDSLAPSPLNIATDTATAQPESTTALSN